MIQISARQWDQLGQGSFASRLIALIRERHPRQAASVTDAHFNAEIARQVVKAKAYGLSDDQSAATYVYTAWLLGPDFDARIPALRQILREPSMSAPAKAQALINFSLTVFHTLDGGDASTQTPAGEA